MDKVKIEDLLQKTNNLSVNQIAAQIKLGEMWKAANSDNYPVKMEKVKKRNQGTSTRTNKGEKFKETIRTTLGRGAFVADGPRLWNNAPEKVTQATTLWKAKREIKLYCKSLPI